MSSPRVTGNFWTDPIEAVNRGLLRGAKKDTTKASGITLIAGCPFETDVQQQLQSSIDFFSKALDGEDFSGSIAWRTDRCALHFTLCGLVLPQHFDGAFLSGETVELITNIVQEYLPLKIELTGMDILGMGAVSIIVSKPAWIDGMRKKLREVDGISNQKFGGDTNKIVVGRIEAPLTEEDRSILKICCQQSQKQESVIVDLDNINIIQFNHRFLENVEKRIRIG